MYFYLNHEKQNINNAEFIITTVLYFNQKTHKYYILEAYDIYKENLIDYLQSLMCFDEITENVSYKVKSSGKIGISINCL